MGKVIIDVSMSLDGFVAGPNDGKAHGLGTRGGEHIFDWFTTGDIPLHGEPLFRPEGVNIGVVEDMYAHMGVMLTGRRTYDITDGWNGRHPVNGIPVVILTHHPPADPPKGESELVFVTTGIEDAVAKSKTLAGDKHVGIGGASAAQQALRAGLVDEIFLHVAPIILGAGVRLFDHIGGVSIRLDPIETISGPMVTHLRYRVPRKTET